jgi:hypothetical protein
VLDRNLNAKHTHKHETEWTAKQGVHYELGGLRAYDCYRSDQAEVWSLARCYDSYAVYHHVI